MKHEATAQTTRKQHSCQMKSAAEYANDFEAFREDIDPDANISESEFYAMNTWDVEALAQAVIEA